jgi:hypothetical protein
MASRLVSKEEELRRKRARRYSEFSEVAVQSATQDHGPPPPGASHVRRHVASRDEDTQRAFAAVGHDVRRMQQGLGNAAVRRHLDPEGEAPTRFQVRDNASGLDVVYDSTGGAPDVDLKQVQQALGSGAPLDKETRAYMEWRFGVSFEKVRIHTDPKADAVSKALFAHAFALGEHVAFQGDTYRPGTASGDRLLAHELMHVVQAGHAPEIDSSVQPASAKSAAPAARKSSSVSEPTDSFEVEADAVADRVVAVGRGEFSRVRREAAAGTLQPANQHAPVVGSAPEQEAPEEETKKGAVADAMDAVQSPGKPLDGGVKQRLEGAFGKDLSDVRVHDDATAAGAAKSLEAAAFAVGTDIVFGEGRYAPGTDAGDHLIAHEVAHTVQNRAAGVTDAVSALEGATPSDVSTRGTGAEVEAHQAADTAMSGGAAAIHRSPDAVISKEDAPTASSNTRLLTNSDGETIGANTHKFFRKEGGVWNVVEVEGTTGAASSTSVGGTENLGSASTSAAVAEGSFGDDNSVVQGSGTVLGAGAEASADVEVEISKVAIKASAGANLTLIGGELVIQTPWLSGNVRGETLKARLGIKLSAEVAASVEGEVAGTVGFGDEGVTADLGASVDAFAGARGGVKVFMEVAWIPAALSTDMPVFSASAGISGWAGAGAHFEGTLSFLPSFKVEYSYGLAWGLGGAMSAALEFQVVNTASLLIVLGGRALAWGLETIGLSDWADAVDRFITDLYADDAARNIVSSGLHIDLPIPQRIDLINKMLDGACMDADEAAIIQIFSDAPASEMRSLAEGVEGGVLRLLDKVNGEERTTLLTLWYVNSALADPYIDDDVARELVSRGLHADMSVEDVRRLINAMLEGATANADEAAILRIVRERADFKTILTTHLSQRCLDDFHGEEYDALAGFFFLEDVLPDLDIDDDVSRAVINQGLHVAVTDDSKLMVLFDEMISGVTGDADEECLVKLMMDCQSFTRNLPADKLDDALSDIDGEEYEDLLVALRKWDRIDLTNSDYDVDDNVGRRVASEGISASLSASESRLLIEEMLSGATGDDDELAILRILNENRGTMGAILDTQELRDWVLSDLNGEEYDSAVALLSFAQLIPDVEIDDDVARAIVRMNLHTEQTDPGALWEMLQALIDGFTGDADEGAIIAICRDCPIVHPELTEARLVDLCDNIDGEEYEEFIVWGRTSGVISDLSADWLSFDDDVARKVVDEVPHDVFSAVEIGTLMRRMNEGYTGAADEERILALLRSRGDVAPALKADGNLINDIISNVHGENETALFVILFENYGLEMNPLHDDFDDDAARAFVDLGFHQDATRMPDAVCRNLVNEMLEGSTGDADEARIITMIRDRDSFLTGKSDPLISDIIGDTHGEEELQLFQLLYEKDKLELEDPHPDFDDDVARHFVGQGFHTDGARFTVLALQKLLERLMEGVAGDDDEAMMQQILTDRTEAIAALPLTTLEDVVAHTHGEEESTLFVLLYKHGRDEFGPDHADFDDDAARLFVAENLHADMTPAQAAKLIDHMVAGATLNDDEGAILKVLTDKIDAVDHLAGGDFNMLLGEFDGEEWDQLLLLLYRAGKDIDISDPNVDFHDDTARLFVSEGAHIGMSGPELKRVITELWLGVTGDEDEDAILSVLRTEWDTVYPELSEQMIMNLYHAIDGEQSDRYQALLWCHEALPDGFMLDDDVARGIIAEGLHASNTIAAQMELLDAMLAGATGNEDEAAILILLQDTAFTASLTSAKVDEIYANLDWGEADQLLMLLLRAGKVNINDERIDDNTCRLLVSDGYYAELVVSDRAVVIYKLLDGACLVEDEDAILTVLRADAGNTASLIAGVDMSELIASFQDDNYYALVGHLFAHGGDPDTLLNNYVNLACARHMALDPVFDTMNPDQRGKIMEKLLEGGSSDGRVVISVFNARNGEIDSFVQEIGLTELREAWSGDEQAEIMVLVYQHSPANQLAVLRDASSETAIKMARMRLNHDMSLHHTSELLQRLTSGSSEGFDYAFEVVQHAADSNQLQALAAQMGGQSEVEDLFTGNMKNDVTALFAGGGG